MATLNLTKIVACIGTIAMVAGGAIGAETWAFVRNSEPLQGKVVQGEVYRGPPRFPGATSLRVQFQTADGQSHTAEAAAPFLRRMEPGDAVPLLVSRSDPEQVRLPFWTELWSWPLGLCAVGIGLLLLSLAIRSVKPTTAKHA